MKTETISGGSSNIYLAGGGHIVGIRRDDEGVRLLLASGERQAFDKVVFAATPDQVLKLLAEPTGAERNRFANFLRAEQQFGGIGPAGRDRVVNCDLATTNAIH